MNNYLNTNYDILIHYKKIYSDIIYKTGIYKIYFIERPEYFYIGKATRINKYNCESGFYSRWKRHLMDFKKNTHRNTFLQNLYNTYGYNSLRFDIIEISSPEFCDVNEKKWFNELKPPTNFQNNKIYRKKECTPNGIKNRSYRVGFKHSEETKNKMSVSQKHRIYTPKKIPLNILDNIINSINNDGKTIVKLSKLYRHSLTTINRCLINYIGETEFGLLKEKSKINGISKLIKSNKSRSTTINDRYEKIIPIIISEYRNGKLLKDIKDIVNINVELISKLIHNNMDKDEIKKIRSKNAKRFN